MGWVNGERRLIEQGNWASPAARAEAAAAAEREAAAAHTERERAAEAWARMPSVAQWVQECIREREHRSRRPIKPTTADNYRKLTLEPGRDAVGGDADQ